MTKRLIVVVAVILLAGCAMVGHKLDGEIVNIDSGVVLPMQIEMSYGSGGMFAYNPESQENFQGRYTGVRGANKLDTANTRALLHGDQGTIITVEMEIQPGFRPIGIGEATDNKGNKYQVQF